MKSQNDKYFRATDIFPQPKGAEDPGLLTVMPLNPDFLRSLARAGRRFQLTTANTNKHPLREVKKKTI